MAAQILKSSKERGLRSNTIINNGPNGTNGTNGTVGKKEENTEEKVVPPWLLEMKNRGLRSKLADEGLEANL